MSNSKNLNNNKQIISDGTLGTWKKKLVGIELRPGTKTNHDRPYPVPCVNGDVFCKEVERLCHLGYFKRRIVQSGELPLSFNQKITER